MPEICDGADEEAGGGGCRGDVVEIAGGITSEEYLAGTPILNRETNIVKFNINWISTCKNTDREEIFDERGGN